MVLSDSVSGIARSNFDIFRFVVFDFISSISTFCALPSAITIRIRCISSTSSKGFIFWHFIPLYINPLNFGECVPLS